MDELNVLITSGIEKSQIEKIQEVDQRIKVQDISGLMRDEMTGDTSVSEKLDKVLAGADVMFGFMGPKNFIERAPRLKWVQIMGAGVDRFVGGDLWTSPVVMTNSSGVAAVPISEYVLSVMLMFVKQARQCGEMKAAREWKRVNFSVLRNKTVGIIGLGSIGKEVARLSKAFGMEVMAVRRSIRKESKARNVDILLPSNQLKRLLEKSDFVVLTLPYTGATEKLIGEKELNTMKPSAHIINISRGGVIDENALIKALEEKRIAGAGLDVFAKEPLPAESKLWDLENVIYSPHASGGMEGYMDKATEVFVDNLKRYLQGKKLKNLIDKKLGY